MMLAAAAVAAAEAPPPVPLSFMLLIYWMAERRARLNLVHLRWPDCTSWMYLSLTLPRISQSGFEAMICGCRDRKSYHQSILGLPLLNGFGRCVCSNVRTTFKCFFVVF